MKYRPWNNPLCLACGGWQEYRQMCQKRQGRENGLSPCSTCGLLVKDIIGYVESIHLHYKGKNNA